MLVVATTEDGLAGVRARLYEVDLTPVEVLALSNDRRLVLAPVADESCGARLVARLRGEGRLAVLRPAGGPRLASWVDHTRPVVVGDRISVCFAWSEHDRRSLPNVVELDPGGGFGSGGHPTTRLLLHELARRVTGGERVLDVGCGSGVLGLAALRLGASGAVGVDIEAAAIEATRRNAVLNGLDRRLDARLMPLAAVEGRYDVIVANIGSTVLVDLGPDLVARLAPGGWLAVSGIAPAHRSLVTAALRPLRVVDDRTCGEWSALVVAHPGREP